MNPLHADIIKAALTNMLRSGHLSICVIDSLLKLTGGIPNRAHYDALRALHCVDFKDMSPRLRLELPRLMQVVLESQPMTFDLLIEQPKNTQIVEKLFENL